MHPSAEQEAQLTQPSSRRAPAAASSSSSQAPAAASSSSDQPAAPPTYHRLRPGATANPAEYHQSGKSQPTPATTTAEYHQGGKSRPAAATTPAEYHQSGKSRMVPTPTTTTAEHQALATYRAQQFHAWRATQTHFPHIYGHPVDQLELPATDPDVVFRNTPRVTDLPNAKTHRPQPHHPPARG